MKKSKYLVRPNDMHIFEIDESNNCYRSYSVKGVKNRPSADKYYTHENLTQNYNFFPIDENDLSIYEYFHDLFTKFVIWSRRSDGHGGCKNSSFEEYKERFLR